MRFESNPQDPEHIAMIERLDDLVQELVHLDVRGRTAAIQGDVEVGQEVAQRVGDIIAAMTWGQMPTILMHLVQHVGVARNDAGRLAGTCNAASDGLTKVSQIMSEAGAPLDLCVQLMDLAVELRTSADECLFEMSDCEGEECNHDD